MPTWPSTLQQNANYDYNESWDDGTIRSQPDQGPMMTRRRYTKIRKFAKMTVWVDRTQYSIFEAFYNLELQGGSLPFTWEDPVTQNTATLLFTSPPSISTVGPNNFKINIDAQVTE